MDNVCILALIFKEVGIETRKRGDTNNCTMHTHQHIVSNVRSEKLAIVRNKDSRYILGGGGGQP